MEFDVELHISPSDETPLYHEEMPLPALDVDTNEHLRPEA
jgi:hypothetical protein